MFPLNIFKARSYIDWCYLSALAKYLQDGDVICLAGDLGAGKTLFVKAVAEGLGMKEEVTSPTFTLLNIYEGTMNLYHFDLYRLENADLLYDIGFDEYTQSGGIVFIEWPDKFAAAMPEQNLWLNIQKGLSEDRIITMKPFGTRYQQLCEELKNIADFRAGYSDASL